MRLCVATARFDPVSIGHIKCNLRTVRAGTPRSTCEYLAIPFVACRVNVGTDAQSRCMRKLYWNTNAL